MIEKLPKHLVLFDGVCNFCDATVQWIIKRDRHSIFYFTGLQSEVGKQILDENQIDRKQTDSVVYVRNQNVHIKSTAALYVLKDLGGIWSLGFIFIIIPKRIRDFFYDYFAKRRYRWFGKKDACMLPSPEQRARFL